MTLLSLKKIVKRYHKRTVVNEVTLDIQAGKITGLLGQNGAGKTTLFKIIMGLLPPEQGKVFFNQQEITRLPIYKRARLGLGYLPQETSTFRELTCRENLQAVLEILKMTRRSSPPLPGISNHGSPSEAVSHSEAVCLSKKEMDFLIDTTLEKYGLAHVTSSKAYTLSGGETRRLEVARIMLAQPQLLLLDEPFSGIDPKACEDIRLMIHRLCNEEGVSILLTDHNVYDTLKVIDEVFVIYEGKIIAHGSPQDIINNPDVRAIYLGQSFSLSPLPS